ncbi:hypothetical protein P8625_03285 [Tenacibaculum tangerinum]|uniref:Uncharacterized protein n=1 Tax=Tenacibaculum tangerinum TaxID=3038772 RepID=A0ABY8L744_9FLAO|nr:hypothetical protein [Tenacibaculum tangerinum]WGH76203.1 hypothetical protein P8625_03285 [Tenacibaculum tangerinum]
MSSTSQKSFSSRLGNAKKLKTIVSNFTNYQPPVEEASVAKLTETIEQIETLQTNYNNVKADYTLKTNERKKIFTENENAIDKQLAPIRAFVEALKGKDSIELSQISTLVNKIRGQVPKKATTKEQTDTKTISQIERTYASRVANFKNIIDILTTLGESYAPANETLSIASLTTLATAAEASTEAVNTALATLKPVIEQRKELYNTLSKQTQDIKNFVKAQYGQTSNEYKQIKGLSI